jgi:hypothetical protein
MITDTLDVQEHMYCITSDYYNLPIYIMTPNGIPIPVNKSDLEHLFVPVGPTSYNGVPIPKHVIIKPPRFEDEEGLFEKHYGKAGN